MAPEGSILKANFQ